MLLLIDLLFSRLDGGVSAPLRGSDTPLGRQTLTLISASLKSHMMIGLFLVLTDFPPPPPPLFQDTPRSGSGRHKR